MAHLRAAGVSCPEPLSLVGRGVPGSAPEAVLRVDKANGGDGINFVRVLSFLPGVPLAQAQHTPELLRDLGIVVTRLPLLRFSWLFPLCRWLLSAGCC